MSELPAGWTTAPLSDLGDEVRGSVVPSAGTSYELYSVPTYPTGRPELVDGAEVGSAKRPVEAGDVLVCKINPRINRVWAVAEPAHDPAAQIASTEYLVFRVAHPDLGRYVMWYLRSPRFRDWIKLSVEGATGSHTRAKSGPILRQEIPLPPLNEQRRIVGLIEQQFSRLDAADTVLAAARRRCDVLRRTSLNRALPRGPMRRLGEVASVVSGQTPKGLETAATGSIPYFKVGDMNAADGHRMSAAREYVSDAHAAAARLRIHPSGTVIFPKRGGAIATNKKRLLVSPAALDLNTMAVVPGEALDPRYLYVYFETLDLASLSDGSNVPQINHGDIAPLPIPVPPLDEQQRVVVRVEEQLSAIDALRVALERTQRRAASLRRALLERAFRGELVPQDPSDEPAALLLERIRTERAAAPLPSRRRRAPA